MMFRELTSDEMAQFEQWAVDNDPPNLESWYLYHPVCRATWERKGIYPPQYVIDSHREESK